MKQAYATGRINQDSYVGSEKAVPCPPPITALSPASCTFIQSTPPAQFPQWPSISRCQPGQTLTRSAPTSISRAPSPAVKPDPPGPSRFHLFLDPPGSSRTSNPNPVPPRTAACPHAPAPAVPWSFNLPVRAKRQPQHTQALARPHQAPAIAPPLSTPLRVQKASICSSYSPTAEIQHQRQAPTQAAVTAQASTRPAAPRTGLSPSSRFFFHKGGPEVREGGAGGSGWGDVDWGWVMWGQCGAW